MEPRTREDPEIERLRSLATDPPAASATAPHWTAAFLAVQPAGEDCADFVVRVMRQRFGRRVVLPQHAVGVRARDRQIAAQFGSAWRRRAGGFERDGDLAVMAMAGRTRSLGHHLGVIVRIDHALHVLHRLERLGVALHAVRRLPAAGLELREVCAWI